MKQQPGQTINSFLSDMHYIWDQLTSSELKFKHATSAKLFSDYRDQHFILFLMVLTNDFKHVRASLLHRSPLPTLDQANTELLSEETRHGPWTTSSSESVLTTPKGTPQMPFLPLPTPKDIINPDPVNHSVIIAKHLVILS